MILTEPIAPVPAKPVSVRDTLGTSVPIAPVPAKPVSVSEILTFAPSVTPIPPKEASNGKIFNVETVASSPVKAA